MYTDKEWIERLQGSPEERDSTIEELRDLLRRGLAKGLGNYLDGSAYIEDMTQEALLKILAAIDTFEGRSRFLTWAMSIATRTGISLLRHKYHRDQSMDAFVDDGGYPIDLSTSERPEESILMQEMLEKLQELIDQDLSEKQRMVLRASLDGYSTDGIAEKSGLNRNSVYKCLHDARVKLKEGLLKSGFAAEDVLDKIA